MWDSVCEDNSENTTQRKRTEEDTSLGFLEKKTEVKTQTQL